MTMGLTLDQRLDKIDGQLDRLAKSVVKGFAEVDKKIGSTELNLRSQIDIYARVVDAYAKQSETYMQEMWRSLKRLTAWNNKLNKLPNICT